MKDIPAFVAVFAIVGLYVTILAGMAAAIYVNLQVIDRWRRRRARTAREAP